MTWVGPLVGTQWSATPIDAPLAPLQVPSENTTQHCERMAPGRLKPEASTLSFRFKRDGLNHAQTSELGRHTPWCDGPAKSNPSLRRQSPSIL